MSQSSWLLLLLLGLAVGFGLTSQAGVNAQLRTAMATPVHAAFVSFVIGTVILGVMAWHNDRTFFTQPLAGIPWWAWLGGALGAFNIALSIYLAPKLGALVLAATIVVGQMLTSLVYDQYGLLGYPKAEINWTRVAGACLLIAGLVLVSRK